MAYVGFRFSLSCLSTSYFSGIKLSLLGKPLRFPMLNPIYHFLINFYQRNIVYRSNTTIRGKTVVSVPPLHIQAALQRELVPTVLAVSFSICLHF